MKLATLFLLAAAAQASYVAFEVDAKGHGRHGRFVPNKAEADVAESPKVKPRHGRFVSHLHKHKQKRKARSRKKGRGVRRGQAGLAQIDVREAGAFNESQAAGRGEQDGSGKKPSVQAKYLQGYCPSAGAKVVTFGADHTEEDSEATTTQPPDLAAENAAKNALSQNVCPYRYYVFEVLETVGGSTSWEIAELRLYFSDKKYGRRTFPASEIKAQLVSSTGDERQEACDRSREASKAFDHDSQSAVCAPGSSVKMLLDLGRPIVLTVYTIISTAGGSRQFDPKAWRLWGSSDGSIAPETTMLLSSPQEVSVPSSSWMCDPPWITEGSSNPEECITTTTTTTTLEEITTTTTTTTTTQYSFCAYRYYCFQVHDTNSGENSWSLAEIEFRHENVKVEAALPFNRKNAWFLDGRPAETASVKSAGTEAFQALDGIVSTYAQSDGSYSDPAREISSGRFADGAVGGTGLAAQLCIDFKETYKANHFVMVSTPRGTPPKSWTVRAAHVLTAEPDKWVVVNNRSSDEPIFPLNYAREFIQEERLTCPQPQVMPCEAMQCPLNHFPSDDNCGDYLCKESDEAKCCIKRATCEGFTCADETHSLVKDPSTVHCASDKCGEEDTETCCVRRQPCMDVDCGIRPDGVEKESKLCRYGACTEEDGCCAMPTCSSVHKSCPEGFTFKANHATRTCETGDCPHEECCDPREVCTALVCPNATHADRLDKADRYCLGTKCDAKSDVEECCRPRDLCRSLACPEATHVRKAFADENLCRGVECELTTDGATCCWVKKPRQCPSGLEEGHCNPKTHRGSCYNKPDETSSRRRSGRRRDRTVQCIGPNHYDSFSCPGNVDSKCNYW